MKTSHIIRALFATMLILGAVILTAPAASATTQLLTCTGWADNTYSPGLINTLRTTTIAGSSQLGITASPLGLCTGVNVQPPIVSGNYQFGATGVTSCNQIATAASSLTVTINWNGGRTTTYVADRTVQRLVATTVVTLSGVVTAGEFVGDTVQEVVIIPNPNPLACLSEPGVMSLKASDTVTITD
jgi:hypothetical protein